MFMVFALLPSRIGVLKREKHQIITPSKEKNMKKEIIIAGIMGLSLIGEAKADLFQCNACPAGNKCDGVNKTACPAGTYAGVGASTCTDCQAGTYQQYSGQASCNACGVGQTSEAKATSCTDCSNKPANSHYTTVNSCDWSCDDGYSSSGDGKCCGPVYLYKGLDGLGYKKVKTLKLGESYTIDWSRCDSISNDCLDYDFPKKHHPDLEYIATTNDLGNNPSSISNKLAQIKCADCDKKVKQIGDGCSRECKSSCSCTRDSYRNIDSKTYFTAPCFQ